MWHRAGAQGRVGEGISKHIGLGDCHTVMALPGARGMDKVNSEGPFHPESGRARGQLE